MKPQGNKKPVSLSHIKDVRYEPESSVLEITFHRGGTHLYLGVPPEIAEELQATESKWAFFLSHIRRVYRSRIKRG